jgi:hypothetical protein
MFKMSKFLWLILIGCSIFVISGCGTGEQKSGDKNAGDQKSEIAAQLQKEHNDFVVKANQEVHNINLKLTELNDKIHAYNEKGRKLSEAQKKEIDEIEKVRASINPRIHEINNVSQEQWENFKTTFEKDIEQVKSGIDKLINELQVK